MSGKDFDGGRAAIIKAMLDKGASVETVARLTGLSTAEIEQLQKHE